MDMSNESVSTYPESFGKERSMAPKFKAGSTTILTAIAQTGNDLFKAQPTEQIA